MANRPSADRAAELLLWFHREPNRYFAEGRRRHAPRPDSEFVLKLAQGRRVDFADPALNDPRMSSALKKVAVAYIRNVYFHPDNDPYQTLGLAAGASQDQIRENFRQLMRLVHPDRQGDQKQWPDACAAQANRAYAMLRDPDARDRLEREAEARAALARAISRAAGAAEASRMPVATWPKPKRRPASFAKPVLPEWLTAGIGSYARKNPAAAAFLMLTIAASLFVVLSTWGSRDGMLVRGARETYASAESLIARVEPLRAAPATGPQSGTDAASKVRPAAGMAAKAPPPHAVELKEPLPSATTPGPATAAPAVVADAHSPSSSTAVPNLASAPTSSTSAPTLVPSASASLSTPAAMAASAPSNAQPPAVTTPQAAQATVDPAAPGSAASPPEDPSRAPAAATMASAPEILSSPGMAANRAGLPAVASAPIASSPPAGPEIEALFASFVETYERGRLDAFAALFDDDADTNLHRGRTAIRAEYDELFRLSQWRRMQLNRVNWRRNGDRAIAKGEITVKIAWRDGGEVEQRLNLDMELMRRDGRVVIARMKHQPRSP